MADETNLNVIKSAHHGAYTMVVVGSGFASSFHLQEWLKHAPPDARVLVLERGKVYSHAWQQEHDS